MRLSAALAALFLAGSAHASTAGNRDVVRDTYGCRFYGDVETIRTYARQGGQQQVNEMLSGSNPDCIVVPKDLSVDSEGTLGGLEKISYKDEYGYVQIVWVTDLDVKSSPVEHPERFDFVEMKPGDRCEENGEDLTLVIEIDKVVCMRMFLKRP